MSKKELWIAAYLAAMSAGKNQGECWSLAEQAVYDFIARFPDIDQ